MHSKFNFDIPVFSVVITFTNILTTGRQFSLPYQKKRLL